MKYTICKLEKFSVIGQEVEHTSFQKRNIQISEQFWQKFNNNLKTSYLSQSGNWIKYMKLMRNFAKQYRLIQNIFLCRRIYCTIFGNKDAPTMLGEKDGSITKELKQVEKMFADANMNPFISDHILDWIYTHFAEAAGLLAGVVQTDDYENFAQNKTVVKQTISAIREGLRICGKRGIAIKKIRPQCYYFLPTFIMVPFMQKMYATGGVGKNL